VTRGGATYDAEVNAVSLVVTDDLLVGSQETHRVLLGARVVIVGGLNFTVVAPGSYNVSCGPVTLEDIDGAPARVLLRRPGAEAA
jgi:kynurenine formamidase